MLYAPSKMTTHVCRWLTGTVFISPCGRNLVTSLRTLKASSRFETIKRCESSVRPVLLCDPAVTYLTCHENRTENMGFIFCCLDGFLVELLVAQLSMPPTQQMFCVFPHEGVWIEKWDAVKLDMDVSEGELIQVCPSIWTVGTSWNWLFLCFL